MDQKLPTKREAAAAKKIVVGLKKTLQQHRFNPVSQLVNHVYPQLQPSEQKEVLLELIKYLFPKAQAEAPKGKRVKQTNIQINNLPNSAPSPQRAASVTDLVRIASSPIEKK